MYKKAFFSHFVTGNNDMFKKNKQRADVYEPVVQLGRWPLYLLDFQFVTFNSHDENRYTSESKDFTPFRVPIFGITSKSRYVLLVVLKLLCALDLLYLWSGIFDTFTLFIIKFIFKLFVKLIF